MSADDRTRSWDQAAHAYDRYFVPRFAPWVTTAVAGLRTAPLLPGPVLVPCCGPFPELRPLTDDHPDREIVGIDLSPGMIEQARRRAAGRSLTRLLCRDATDLASMWPGTAAAVVSVFGLQQLPDPVGALADWLSALRPGGRLSVVYWPPRTEPEGPFQLLDTVVDQATGTGTETARDDTGQSHLAERLTAAGAVVDRDEDVSHPISHPDAETFWTAMVDGGPLRRLALSRGEAFMADLRARFLRQAPPGPWHHRPRARWILAQRL
jgi:SAM-dependent methyltransferase